MILTFDDGPSEWTLPILDLLAEYDVAATFFVLGQRVFLHKALIIRMHRDGHTVGVHGFTHRRLTDLTDTQIQGELRSSVARIHAVTGRAPHLFRAPFYGTDDRVNGIAAGYGLEHYGSDVIPDDWMLDDPEEIARRVLVAGPSQVVTLHDGVPPDGGSERCTSSRQPTVDGLKIVLETA